MAPKVLIVTTSADKLGDHATGLWSEELTGAYYVFKAAGAEITIASVAGGKIPIDQGSLADGMITENDKRWAEDESVKGLLDNTPSLKDVQDSEFDILYCPGGHGTCVDYPDNLGPLVTKAYGAGKVVASVCHGPTALVNAKGPDGEPIVKGKKIAVFSDVEEGQVGLTEKVPFLLEQRLIEQGGLMQNKDPWTANAVADGKLITGQNPQSSVDVAKLALAAL